VQAQPRDDPAAQNQQQAYKTDDRFHASGS
jgi:hypothetical protein